MRIEITGRWASAVFVAGLALALLGAVTIAAAGGERTERATATITVCAKKVTGALRMAKACAADEVAVTWNQTGPTGPTGPAGQSGPAGSIGTVQLVSATTATNNWGAISKQVSCPGSLRSLGGGARVNAQGYSSPDLIVNQSFPLSTGYYAAAQRIVFQISAAHPSFDWSLTVYAVCG